MTCCPSCHAPAVHSAGTVHCLRCPWERPISPTARRRLVADVLGTVPRRRPAQPRSK